MNAPPKVAIDVGGKIKEHHVANVEVLAALRVCVSVYK